MRQPSASATEQSPAGQRYSWAWLACGVFMPLLWVGMDVFASLLYDGYSYVDQTISELSAIGAPTRTFWAGGSVICGLLELAFAFGVWRAAERGRALRVVAALFAVHALYGLTVGPFSSMHQREVLAEGGATLSDTLHLVLVTVGSVIYFSQMGLAASVFGRRFRLYTLATGVVMVVFGSLTVLDAPDIAANEPTPLVGIYERISAYAYMVWVALLALTVMARTGERRAAQGGAAPD